MKQPLAGTSGFTIVEMIIVVGVMAVLAGLSFPAITQYMRQQDIRNEETALANINKAMVAYAKANNRLPDDAVTNTALSTFWARELARFSNMSPDQIMTDSWGNARRYIEASTAETFLGTDINILYATVHSRGPDRIAQGGTGIPVLNSDFRTATTASVWWKDLPAGAADPAASFQAIDITQNSDDMMTRFSDYGDKVDRYNTTLERLTKISAALETYSKQKFAEAVAGGVTNPEKDIYYPRSLGVVVSTDDVAANYAASVLTDTALYAPSSAQYIWGNHSTTATRQTAMVALMRIIGLPDEYCCSALSSYKDASGVWQDEPFYFFSNPRPRTSSTTCGTRTDPAAGLPLPPRITVDYQADGNANSTCG